MNIELSESVKQQLIQILNQNIKLEEAYYKDSTKIGSVETNTIKKDNKKKDKDSDSEKTLPSQLKGKEDQSGVGAPTLEKEPPKYSFKEIMLGPEEKGIPGIDIEDPMTSIGLLGAGLATTAAGGFLSKIPGVGKIAGDVATLTGVPGALAQVKDIVPYQTALRWEGSGTHGWFRPMVPKTK